MSAISQSPVAIVTGGARGIGRACVLALGAAGFHVAVADLSEADASLLETTSEVEALGVEAVAVRIDVARLEAHEALIAAAISRWGRLDCLVNNAGVGVLARGDVLDVTPESFDRCVHVNTRAVFFLAQIAARHFRPDMSRVGEMSPDVFS